jgi:hypothetical protein
MIAEPGTITSVEIGERETRFDTYLTFWINIAYDSGRGQSFGGCAFPLENERYHSDKLEEAICSRFGVKRFQDLKGRRCVALVGEDYYIVGIRPESEGQAFILKDWWRENIGRG